MMGKGDRSVLVVEDDDDVRDVAANILEAAGYRVFEAVNADAAYRRLCDHPDLRIDVLFTDIVMPGRLDGISLAEAARRLRPDLKVLYASGFSELVRSHRGAPMWGRLLRKPYRAKELREAVEALLGHDGVHRD
jgi:CheY-like chemotaxis protein